ncbi:MAG TPA: Ig-like domain-containing protein [Candidatus Binatia bacterium]|nr:Ig-like domain-containing protein [Candidatus Binatia bacterium]
MTVGRGRTLLRALLLGAVVAAIGCAKSVFPPGGPLDVTPPRVIATTPADSSVRVDRTTGVDFLFSEDMDHGSVRDATRIRPPVERPQFRWSGRHFRVFWGETLRVNTTYHVVLRGSVRDAHGVPLGAPVSIHFSTGDSLAPGKITGVVRARTLSRSGVPILVFSDSLGARPDTGVTFEPLYEAATDTAGAYSIPGMILGPEYRVFAFYDRNANNTYDEGQDVLAPHPEPIRLTPERPVADSINIVAVDPRALAVLSGTIVASDSTSRYRVEARGAADSTVTAPPFQRTGPGAFSLRVPAGTWTLRAFRLEGPGGSPPRLELRAPEAVVLRPEEERGGFTFDFRPAEGPGAPPPPPPRR